jgi:thiol:disulfide interchange protein DsbD
VPSRLSIFIPTLLLTLLPKVAFGADFAAALGQGTSHAFLFAFTAGLLTALTPCVYPMIPITISVFGGRGGASRTRAFALATVYVAGIAVMFGSLGTTFALLGKAFGTFLGNPFVIVPLALFFFAMAASMFGAFNLALPSGLQQRLSAVGGRGFLGAFLMGLVGGLIAAPCTGPPLAGILAYVATTRDAVLGFFLLATYATGIGVPFWLIAGFSVQLPKSGPWMDGVKAVFGIALVVAGLYDLKPVLPFLGTLTGRSPIFLGGLGAMLVAGIALGAVHRSFGGLVDSLRKGVGIALCVGALFAFTNYLLTPALHVAWLTDEAKAVALAKAENKRLLVDFQADWCLPCKEMDARVFGQPDVAPVLSELVLLKLDVTQEDDAIDALKTKYDVATLPAVRLVSPTGQVLGGLNQLVDIPTFIDFVGAHP